MIYEAAEAARPRRTLRSCPSVAASLSIRVALLVQAGQEQGQKQRRAAVHGNDCDVHHNDCQRPRAQFSFPAMPGTTGTYGRCRSRSGAVRYTAKPRSAADSGGRSPNRRINKTREIGHVLFARLPEQARFSAHSSARCSLSGARRARRPAEHHRHSPSPHRCRASGPGDHHQPARARRASPAVRRADRRLVDCRFSMQRPAATRTCSSALFPNNGPGRVVHHDLQLGLQRRHSRPGVQLQLIVTDLAAAMRTRRPRSDHQHAGSGSIVDHDCRAGGLRRSATRRRSPMRDRTRTSTTRTASRARTSRSTRSATTDVDVGNVLTYQWFDLDARFRRSARRARARC